MQSDKLRMATELLEEIVRRSLGLVKNYNFTKFDQMEIRQAKSLPKEKYTEIIKDLAQRIIGPDNLKKNDDIKGAIAVLINDLTEEERAIYLKKDAEASVILGEAMIEKFRQAFPL